MTKTASWLVLESVFFVEDMGPKHNYIKDLDQYTQVVSIFIFYVHTVWLATLLSFESPCRAIVP